MKSIEIPIEIRSSVFAPGERGNRLGHRADRGVSGASAPIYIPEFITKTAKVLIVNVFFGENTWNLIIALKMLLRIPNNLSWRVAKNLIRFNAKGDKLDQKPKKVIQLYVFTMRASEKMLCVQSVICQWILSLPPRSSHTHI